MEFTRPRYRDPPPHAAAAAKSRNDRSAPSIHPDRKSLNQPTATITTVSYLLQLLGDDQRIGPGDRLPPHRLEIEGAAVFLRVPVDPAEGHAAPAPESGQTYLLPARRAPVRRRLQRLRLWHRLLLHHHRRGGVDLSLLR